ncbi:MAG: SPOR domain-containing protein [Candidatus Methylomirabilales bacterium]
MRKFNFLKGSSNPSERTTLSLENLSPQAKRLALIGIVGIVLVGAFYLYTSYFAEVPPPPPPPLALRGMGAKRTPLPTPVRPPEAKPEATKPPVAVRAPKPEKPERKEEAAPLAVEGRKVIPPPVAAKPTEVPPETPKRAETPADAKTVPPEPPAKVEGKKRYSVQVASLVFKRNALSLKGRLEKLGYSPIIQRTTAPITRHRVYAGEFTSREEAERTARRLNVDGFPSNLVEMGQGKFSLEVGSSFHLNDAIDLAHNLQKKNYTSKIVSKAVPTPVHQVRVGGYENRSEALKTLETLKKQGFAPLIVRR